MQISWMKDEIVVWEKCNQQICINTHLQFLLKSVVSQTVSQRCKKVLLENRASIHRKIHLPESLFSKGAVQSLLKTLLKMRLQDGCFLLNFATLSQTPILNQIHQADSAGEYLRSTSNINRSHYLRNSYSCICHKGLYLNVKAAIAIPLLTSSPSCNHYSKHIHAAMGTNFIILLTSILVPIK